MPHITARFRRRSILAAVLVMVSALTSCSPEPEAAEQSEPIKSFNLEAEEVWSVDMNVISQVWMADGTGVVHVRAPDDQLQLVAVDAETGKELWRRFVAPGWGDGGSDFNPILARTNSEAPVVAYVEPSPDEGTEDYAAAWSTSVVVAEARTGRELARSPRQTLGSRPSPCWDGKDLCYTELSPGSEDVIAHRIVLDATPHFEQDAGNPLSGFDHSFEVDGLYFRSDELKGDFFGRIKDGEKLWENHIERFFGAGYDTFYGSAWQLFEDHDLIVLSVERRFEADPWLDPAHEEGEYVPRDLVTRKQVAINIETGKIEWARTGRDSRCVDRWGAADDDVPVRCAYEGTASYDGEKRTYTNIDITAEGFNPKTGDTIWSHDFPVDNLERIDSTVPVRGDVLLTERDGKPALLNTATGEVSPAEGDMVFACSRETEFTYHQSRWKGGPPYKGYGGNLFHSCDASGKPLDAKLSLSALNTLGPNDDLTLVGLDGKLTAYKTPQTDQPELEEKADS